MMMMMTRRKSEISVTEPDCILDCILAWRLDEERGEKEDDAHSPALYEDEEGTDDEDEDRRMTRIG